MKKINSSKEAWTAVGRIEEKLDDLAMQSKKVTDALYGNGREGLITVVSKNCMKIKAVLWFGGVVVVALISLAVRLAS